MSVTGLGSGNTRMTNIFEEFSSLVGLTDTNINNYVIDYIVHDLKKIG